MFLARWGEPLYILIVVLAMFTLRAIPFSRFIGPDGVIVFTGNDPWYHLRAVEYTVRNWPDRLVYDPWTGYPSGAVTGQFGTLYDQILATAALLIGLGNPDETTVRLVVLFAPTIFGAAVALPTYYVVKKLDGRMTAAIAIGLLALLPGVFFSRGLVGVSDHNIAEPFFLMVFIGALVAAIQRARADVLIVELLSPTEIAAVRKPVLLSVFAGLAGAMYLSVWSPGLFTIVLLAGFFALMAVFDYRRGNTPDAVLLVGVISMVTLMLLSLTRVETFDSTFIQISIVHVLVPLFVVVECLALLGLARVAESRDFSVVGYVGLTGGLAAVAVGALFVVAPGVFDAVFTNGFNFVTNRFNPQTQTIAEARSLLGLGVGPWYSLYGLLPVAAVVGFVLLMVRAHTEDSPERLLVALFALMFAVAGMMQIRFNYYFAVFVAILAAYAIARVMEVAEIPTSLPRLASYQVIALILVAMVVVPGLVYPVSGTVYGYSEGHNVGEYTGWDSTLEWMATETPAVESDEFDYYGEYDKESFVYPDSAYSTLSWWDYGHWLTVTGEQIPIANPFQQHARYAAEVLLSTNESDVALITEERFGEEFQPRYVVVDWKMVTPTSKMGALTVFDESVDAQDLSRQTYYTTPTSVQAGPTLLSDRYYQSFAVRLYHFHGSAALPEPYVVTTTQRQVRTQNGQVVTIEAVPQDVQFVQRFQTLDQAQAYVEQNPSAQIGGIGTLPPSYVPALQHYRLVKVSPEASFDDPGYENSVRRDLSLTRLSPTTLIKTPSWVKVFERVPGATVHGHGPANATVRASVPLYVPEFNQTFTYQQYAQTDETGHFEMVLPYSTTGYEGFTAENGYTNTTVRGTEAYQFASVVTEEVEGNQTVVIYEGTAEVPESFVVGASEGELTVDLEGSPYTPPSGGNQTASDSSDAAEPAG